MNSGSGAEKQLFGLRYKALYKDLYVHWILFKAAGLDILPIVTQCTTGAKLAQWTQRLDFQMSPIASVIGEWEALDSYDRN